MKMKLLTGRLLAIEPVADHGTAGTAAMNADLMRAASLGRKFEPRHAGRPAQNFVPREGGLALVGRLHRPAAPGVHLEQRPVERAFVGGCRTFDDSPVSLLRLAALEDPS